MEKEITSADLGEHFDIEKKPGDRKWKLVSVVLAVMLVLVATIGGFVYTELQTLQHDHEQLQADHDSLSGQYDNLTADYLELQDENAGLQNQYNQLGMNYSLLTESYNQLQNSYELTAQQYNSLIESILLRHGGEQYARQFLTPNDSAVVSETQQVLGSGYDRELTWSDMNKINDWIHGNIVYNSDTDPTQGKDKVWGDCWLYPSETLEKMRGDCEDQVILFASICLADQPVGYVYCALLVLDGQGHMAIFINVAGDTMVVYDPVSGYVSPYSMSESTCLSSYAAAVGVGNIQVISVFNQQVYESFGSNEEFTYGSEKAMGEPLLPFTPPMQD